MSPGTRASSLLPHEDQRLHFFMAFIAFGGAAAFAAFIAFIAMEDSTFLQAADLFEDDVPQPDGEAPSYARGWLLPSARANGSNISLSANVC